MYAVIKSGSKQYRVKKGDVIDVELLSSEVGQEVVFEDVLFFNDGKASKVGGPSIKGLSVKGKMLGIVRGPKVTSIKYKQRKNQRKKWGHRQGYAQVEITNIG
jgi:large subunit ribosomal protein L21